MARLLVFLLLLAGANADAQPVPDAWARSVLGTLSLGEKLGQLFVTDASEREDDPDPRARLLERVERFGVGGVWFSTGRAAEQAALTRTLQARAPLPLLVAQDMENGAGMRVEDATAFPAAMALGAARDTALVYAMGRHVAEEARALGVHLNLAPVADVNSNPHNPIINVRSFGEDPEAVAALAAAYVRGLQDGGVIAAAKHFPGHGDTATDSHDALPVLPFDRARLDSVEFVPFRRAIAAGVQSVMTGHLAVPALEPDALLPATLSPRVIQGVLRDDLGFDGLVITDGLNMRGLTAGFGPGEAAVRAVEAGADLLLLSEDERAARDALLDAVRRGRLTEARIDRSVLRILRAKARLGLHRSRTMPDALDGALRQRGRRLAGQIARRSATLLRNDRGRIPLLLPEPCVLVVSLSDGTEPDAALPFVERLRGLVAPPSVVTHRVLGPRAGRDAFDRAFALVERHDVVLVPIYRRVLAGEIGLSEAERAFVERLVAFGKPVVTVTFGSPYVALHLERAAAEVAAYDASAAVQAAVAEALLGQSPFAGRLPVSLPGLFRVGDGIALAPSALRTVPPDAAGFDPADLARVDTLIEAAIRARGFPGAALAVGVGGQVVKMQGYGRYTYDEDARPVTPESVFDLASLTKVAGTTLAAMRLYDEGRLDLDAPVAAYVPAFGQRGKERVTVRQLLAHTAGQRAFAPFHTMGLTTRDAVLDFIHADSLHYAPGSATVYSDFDMIVLGEVVEAVAGQKLDAYLRETFYAPLGMADTGFRRTGTLDPLARPTEIDTGFRGRVLRGEVHDEAASILGGVAGHAGLFSTAPDLARLAFLLTSGGEAYGRRFFSQATLDTFTARARPSGEFPAALGWIVNRPAAEGYSSAGRRMGPRAFGHTGFTGTSLWIDPGTKLWVILLTNRTYPRRGENVLTRLRPAVADLVVEAFEKGRAAGGTGVEQARYTGPVLTQPPD